MCGFTVPTTLHKCLLHGTVPLGRAITLVPGTSVSLSTQLSYFLFLPDGCSTTWLSTQTELASWYRNWTVDMTYFKTPWRNNLFQKLMDPSLDYILQYTKVHHYVCNRPPLVLVLSHMNTLIFPSMPRSSKRALIRFFHHNPIYISLLSHVFYMPCPYHLHSFNLLTVYWDTNQDVPHNAI